MRRVAAPLAALLFFGTATLSAQDEPGLLELTQEIRDRLQAIGRLMRARELELTRRVVMLERLTRGAQALGDQQPMIGHDAARHGLAAAREIAEQEPLLDRGVFQMLDRAEAALDRIVVGDTGGAVAARFLSEVLTLEQATTDEVGSYLLDLGNLRRLTDGIDRSADQDLEQATQALQRLFLVHAAALRAREAAAP
jgi:hypothetical protein